MGKTFNYREVCSAYQRIGFRKSKGRRHNIFLTQTVLCLNNETHTISIPLKTNKNEDICENTLKTILTSSGLSKELLNLILIGKFKKEDYLEHISKISKSKLLKYYK